MLGDSPCRHPRTVPKSLACVPKSFTIEHFGIAREIPTSDMACAPLVPPTMFIPTQRQHAIRTQMPSIVAVVLNRVMSDNFSGETNLRLGLIARCLALQDDSARSVLCPFVLRTLGDLSGSMRRGAHLRSLEVVPPPLKPSFPSREFPAPGVEEGWRGDIRLGVPCRWEYLSPDSALSALWVWNQPQVVQHAPVPGLLGFRGAGIPG